MSVNGLLEIMGRVMNQDLERRVLENLAHNPMIDTETSLAAAAQITALADRENVDWALCGGLAMHLYGSDRLTKDADVVASNFLSRAGARRLSFGGIAYEVPVGAKIVPVDWIVRNDDLQEFYRAALADAYVLENGWRLLSPEWLVILKAFAGRPKDRDDAVFLLQQENLVNRDEIRERVRRVAGASGWGAVRRLFRDLYDLADGVRTVERKYLDPI
jgi:hypothetical protein